MKNRNKIRLYFLVLVGAIFLFLGNSQVALAAPPTATNLSAAETYAQNTVKNLTDIVTGDTDGDQLTITLTMSDPLAGKLSTATAGAATSTFSAQTGVWSARIAGQLNP